MSDAKPPHFPLTHTDHAAWIVVVTITFLIYSILGVLGSKFFHRVRIHQIKSYDWAIVVAVLFDFAQAVSLIRACISGLGQHQLSLSRAEVESFRKLTFTASFLSIVTFVSAKVSITFFVMAIIAQRAFKIASYSCLALIIAWGISSLFLLAFRCGSSPPWASDEGKCLDTSKVSIGIGVGNMLTDVGLVVLPAMVMKNVQIDAATKFRIVALFASRLLVVVMLIVQATYLGQHAGSSDLTWDLVEPSILGQIALNLSIITACIPALKSGLEMLFSGASQFVVPSKYQTSHTTSSNKHIGGLLPSKVRTLLSGDSSQRQLTNGTSNSRHKPSESFLRSKERSDARNERSESQTNLRDATITRTTEIEVYVERGKHGAVGNTSGLDFDFGNTCGPNDGV